MSKFTDGVMNFVNLLANTRNATAQNAVVSNKVPDEQLRAVYKSGLGNKIIRLKAGGALKNTLEFESKEDKKFYENRLQDSVRRAANFMLAFGRSIIVIHHRGDDLGSPLGKVDRSRVIYSVFSGDMVYAHAMNFDIQSEFYLKPKFYQVRGTKIHHTRVIDFTYVEAPELEKPTYRYGGISEFELIYAQIVNDGIVERVAPTVLEKNAIPTIKVKGFKAALQTKKEQDMVTYFTTMEGAASVYGARLLDSEDEIGVTNQTLTNLSEVDMITLRRLSMVTGIPLPYLVGESVRGMNSAGETERQVMQDMWEDLQEQYLQRPITELMMKSGQGRVWFKENQGWTPLTRMDYETKAIANAQVLWTMGEDHEAYLNERSIVEVDEMKVFFNEED